MLLCMSKIRKLLLVKGNRKEEIIIFLTWSRKKGNKTTDRNTNLPLVTQKQNYSWGFPRQRATGIRDVLPKVRQVKNITKSFSGRTSTDNNDHVNNRHSGTLGNIYLIKQKTVVIAYLEKLLHFHDLKIILGR